MILLALILVISVLNQLQRASALRHTVPNSRGHRGNSSNWAVLVAGSNGYYNYRHQADIAHAYQILTKMGGFPAENVIVLMYNDVVNASENPLPGQLFNEPNGGDVYGDIVVDYSAENVTAETFLNVLKGIKNGSTLNGPVLQSTKNDNVFIYYSDHGATGLVAMPTGAPLYATDLNAALEYMRDHGMFAQLVFYLEACESGSMFEGILANDTNVFATTAATADQPSYAFYYNDTLSTYMADEYSIRWMQDSTQNWDAYESLLTQFEDVAAIVKESQPQKYGDEEFEEEPIEDFEAFEDRSSRMKRVLSALKKSKSASAAKAYDTEWAPSSLSVSSRDVKLAVLQHRYLSAKGAEAKALAASLVSQELDYRANVDRVFDELVEVATGYNSDEADGPLFGHDHAIEAIKHGHILPTNFECLKKAYAAYEANCEAFSDYSLQYVSVLVNLCELFGDYDRIRSATQTVC